MGEEVLGLKRGTVRLVDSQAVWPAVFERLAADIRLTLRDLALGIEHVGSTAVPGLKAKPIIDIAIRLAPDAHVEAIMDRLGSLKYTFVADLGDSGGLAFFLNRNPMHGIVSVHISRDEEVFAHLHVVGYEDPQWERYLIVRDALRADPALRDEYATLKGELSTRFAENRTAYTDGKAPFMTRLLAERANSQ